MMSQQHFTQRRSLFHETVRTRNAKLVYNDQRRCRFVVYRRAGGILRKTSVRHRLGMGRFFALVTAHKMAKRLRACPAHKLAQFRFT